MKHTAFFIGSLVLSVSTACSSSSSPPASSSTGDIKIEAAAANNYSFSSEIKLATLSVAEKSTLTFDWSTLTKDMYGRTIDPKTGIGAILVTIWKNSKAVLEAQINADELVASERAGAGYLFTQGTLSSTTTDSLTTDGATPLPQGTLDSYFSAANFPAADNTFLVMIQSDGETPGKDALQLTTFTLSSDSSSPTTVTIDDTSTDLTFGADFSKLTPTQIPAGTSGVTFDWTDMTENALGHPVDDPYVITRVLVASYSQPTSELQKNDKFPELESLADDLWESNSAELVSTKLSLSKLKNSQGEVFAGIDAEHTWILALQCGECLNPAPWYITVLEPG